MNTIPIPQPRRFLTPDWTDPILPGDSAYEDAPYEEAIWYYPTAVSYTGTPTWVNPLPKKTKP